MLPERLPGAEVLHYLLPLLRDIDRAADWPLTHWDRSLRLARQSRLLGLLAHRLAARPELLSRVPEPVQGHLRGAINYSAHRAQMVRMELAALAAALPPAMPVVLLKGAGLLIAVAVMSGAISFHLFTRLRHQGS